MASDPTPFVTAPVTNDLLDTLTETEAMFKQLDAPGARTNDKDHYGVVVLLLEQLAKEAMRAQTSGSLLTPKTDGARFAVNPHGPVAVSLNEAASYLANDAANLLRHGGAALSQYQRDHLVTVTGKLTKLYGALTHQIRIQAERDMDRVQRDRGVAALVSTAIIMAKIASGDTVIDWAEVLKTATQS